jgi:hypothetical protein
MLRTVFQVMTLKARALVGGRLPGVTLNNAYKTVADTDSQGTGATMRVRKCDLESTDNSDDLDSNQHSVIDSITSCQPNILSLLNTGRSVHSCRCGQHWGSYQAHCTHPPPAVADGSTVLLPAALHTLMVTPTATVVAPLGGASCLQQ